MNRKILFLINGLGLGNSTRCLAIIEKLIEKNVRFQSLHLEMVNGFFKTII